MLSDSSTCSFKWLLMELKGRVWVFFHIKALLISVYQPHCLNWRLMVLGGAFLKRNILKKSGEVNPCAAYAHFHLALKGNEHLPTSSNLCFLSTGALAEWECAKWCMVIFLLPLPFIWGCRKNKTGMPVRWRQLKSVAILFSKLWCEGSGAFCTDGSMVFVTCVSMGVPPRGEKAFFLVGVWLIELFFVALTSVLLLSLLR